MKCPKRKKGYCFQCLNLNGPITSRAQVEQNNRSIRARPSFMALFLLHTSTHSGWLTDWLEAQKTLGSCNLTIGGCWLRKLSSTSGPQSPFQPSRYCWDQQHAPLERWLRVAVHPFYQTYVHIVEMSPSIVNNRKPSQSGSFPLLVQSHSFVNRDWEGIMRVLIILTEE